MGSTDIETKYGLLSLFHAREFPSRKNTEILDLSRISDGWETEVYSFAAEYGPTAERVREELILRIYPGDNAPQTAAREYQVMKQLHAVGFPVPRVLLLELDIVFFGKPFVVMEKIDGRSMGAISDESPMAKKLELLTRFCRILVDLHALDWRPFLPESTGDETADVSQIVRQELSQWQTYTLAFKNHAFDPIFDWLQGRIADVHFGRPSVIHMDYHPYNILLRDDGAAFVIDWTGAQVSDYRLDLAWTLLLMSTYGNPEVRELVLREYERIAGHKAEQIEFFEVAACLRRLASIQISLSQGAEKLGMREGAEAMMADVDHITSVYAFLQERTDVRIAEIEELVSTLS
jgi:aminoglycoside phosphotransferase (APT) family kinase protein